MPVRTLNIRTRSRSDLVDITREVAHALAESGVQEGLCVVYVPHTTAGVTINEHADPDVAADVISALDGMVPWSGSYAHVEGNSAAHVKASLMGSSVTIPVQGGRLQLGTWQGVFFCEFDGPRSRSALVSCLAQA